MLRSKGGGYSCGSNGCLIFCGALLVVLVFFFFCNIKASAPGNQERICPDVLRAGVTAVVVVCVIVVFGALFGVFVFFIFILQQHRSGQRGVGFSVLHERVLCRQFVPSQLSLVHVACLTFAVH